MARKWKQEEYEYQQKYIRDNLKRVLVTFNKNNPDDMELLLYLESKKNKSGYIKDLIREDMLYGEAKDYGEVYDYMRDDFKDGKADVCERICQSLMKNGVLIIHRTDHIDRARFKWLLRGKKQKDIK